MRRINVKFHTKKYKMESGERCCLLVDELGMPAFGPTLYVTTNIRNAGKSVAVAEQCLTSIKILIEFCDQEEIDLEQRIDSKAFLTLGEMDALRDACQKKRQRVKAINVLTHKNGYVPPVPKVKTTTAYIYLTRIAAYLKWLCQYYLGKLRFSNEGARGIEDFVTAILERRAFIMGRNDDDEVIRGISDAQELLLFDVMRPGNPRNPFTDPAVQFRNYLIIKMLRVTAERGGEALNIQIGDLDFNNNQLRVVRRPDAPEDHRANQPRVKTQQRVLPLVPSTMAEVRHYIVEVRKRIPNSARDPYLFVTHKSGPTQGKALSLSSLHEMFYTIAAAHPELEGVTAHDLRHRWNYAYSKAMKAHPEISHAEAEQLRNSLAGWTTMSKQGEQYSAAYIREEADKAMLSEQERFEEKIRATQAKKTAD
jgi:integrase